MTSFVAYDSAGTITACGQVPDELYPLQVPAAGMTMTVIAALPPNRADLFSQNYVLAGAVVAKQPIAATPDKTTLTADGVDVCVISGLPDPCTVSIAGSGGFSVAPTVVTGGSITLTVDNPDDLTVSVTANPAWLPWSVTIHAV